jgi:hypothetical protein
MSWKPDPFAWRTDTFAVSWTDLSGYALPLSVDQPVLRKGASRSGVFVDSDANLAGQAVVSTTVAPVCGATSSAPVIVGDAQRPKNGRPLSSGRQSNPYS